MTLRIYCSEVDARYDNLLKGLSLSSIAESAIWLVPTEPRFEAEDYELVSKAFAPISFITSTSGSSPKLPIEIRDQLRAFGEYTLIKQSVVMEVTQQFFSEDENIDKRYFDVALITPETFEQFAYYARGFWGFISLVPPTKEAAKNWSKIMYSTDGIRSCYKMLWKTEHPSLSIEIVSAVITNYIFLTQFIGGLPCMMCHAPDTDDAKRLFLILGPQETIKAANDFFVQSIPTISDDTFNHWLTRGIELPH